MENNNYGNYEKLRKKMVKYHCKQILNDMVSTGLTEEQALAFLKIYIDNIQKETKNNNSLTIL